MVHHYCHANVAPSLHRALKVSVKGKHDFHIATNCVELIEASVKAIFEVLVWP